MPRIRLDFAYDGTDFNGWAKQPQQRTIEGVLELATATILRVPTVRLVVAGRTDAGVHAHHQVLHMDLDEQTWNEVPGRAGAFPERMIVRRLNGILPEDIRIHSACVVPETFDARFSALSRAYIYRIADAQTPILPSRRRDTWHQPIDFNLAAMNDASELLLGEHDWAAFCRARPGATTIRRLLELHWVRGESGYICGRIRADAFCHHMVRSLVGALTVVARGNQPPTWPRDVLNQQTKDPLVAVVPAQGLALTDVEYPPDNELDDVAALRRARRTLRL